MSSLNAACSDGYYIPPEYIDSGTYKKKSRNQYVHDKAKNIKGGKGKVGHNQYLTRSVVRFEFPYDGFCQNPDCGAHVGKGTRFNAHKSHVDDYFTTKIYEFQMKCRICAKETFYIRTNPQNRCFDYVKGIKKKNEEFDTKDAGTYGVIDTENGNSIMGHADGTSSSKSPSQVSINPLDQLEKEIVGKRKAMTEHDAMEYLLQHNSKILLDDAISNSNLRATYRVGRKAKKKRLKEAKQAGLGKGIELYESTKEDKALARRAFRSKEGADTSHSKEKEKFKDIRAISIFTSTDNSTKEQLRSSKKTSKTPSKPSKGTQPVSKSFPVKSTTGSLLHDKKKERICIKMTAGSLKPTMTTKIIQRSSDQNEAQNSSLLALQSYSSSDSE